MRLSFLDSCVHLWSVYPEVRLGKLGRRQIFKILLKTRKQQLPKLPQRFAIDYNANKNSSVRRVFGLEMPIINPFEWRFPFVVRVLISASMLLPHRCMNVLVFALVLKWFSFKIKRSHSIYLVNPYGFFHHGFGLLEANYLIYFHHWMDRYSYKSFSPATLYAPRPVLDFYSRIYPTAALYHVVPTEFCYSTDDKYLAIYFTNLSYCSVEEERLREFVSWLALHSNLEIKIFLHYHDSCEISVEAYFRKRGDAHLLPFVQFRTETNDQASSLMRLSSNQISLSATSSIAFELLSLGINHFFLFDRQKVSDRNDGLMHFLMSQQYAIDCDKRNHEILKILFP